MFDRYFWNKSAEIEFCIIQQKPQTLPLNLNKNTILWKRNGNK